VANTNLTNATALAPAVAAAGTALVLVGVMGARGKSASRDQVTPVQANAARFSRRRGAQVHDRRQLEVRKGHDVGLAGSLGVVNVRVQIAKDHAVRPNRVPFAARIKTRECITSNRVQAVARLVATGRYAHL